MPPVRTKHLAALVTARTGTPSPEVPLPTPGDVLYAPPNGDGKRKNCVNCALWEQADGTCFVHGDRPIGPDMVCGYHVFGRPQVFAAGKDKPPAMDPELTGLAHVPGGTSCDVCRYFDGKCRAVADPRTLQAPFGSQPLGCCARWRLSGAPP